MSKIHDEILYLRSLGKTYDEIASELSCSKSTVCYHLDDKQRTKTRERQKVRRKHENPLIRKVENFLNLATYLRRNRRKSSLCKNIRANINKKLTSFTRDRYSLMYDKRPFTMDDVMNQIGEHPKCYITGLPIDLSKSSTYSLDHIIPVSRGGDNSLDNMGLCTKNANMAKSDMTLDEFLNLCKLTLQNHGYDVIKKEGSGIEPKKLI